MANHAKVKPVFVNAAAYFVEFLDPWRDSTTFVGHIIAEATHSAKYGHYRPGQQIEVVLGKPSRWEGLGIGKQYLKTVRPSAS